MLTVNQRDALAASLLSDYEYADPEIHDLICHPIFNEDTMAIHIKAYKKLRDLIAKVDEKEENNGANQIQRNERSAEQTKIHDRR